jgi:hypothetical protein
MMGLRYSENWRRLCACDRSCSKFAGSARNGHPNTNPSRNAGHRGVLIAHAFSLIYRSRIVICDFSRRNPNVFHEAGIARTLSKVASSIPNTAPTKHAAPPYPSACRQCLDRRFKKTDARKAQGA